MTYELVDKKTLEVVCVFSARTPREAYETVYMLDPDCRFHYQPVRK